MSDESKQKFDYDILSDIFAPDKPADKGKHDPKILMESNVKAYAEALKAKLSKVFAKVFDICEADGEASYEEVINNPFVTVIERKGGWVTTKISDREGGTENTSYRIFLEYRILDLDLLRKDIQDTIDKLTDTNTYLPTFHLAMLQSEFKPMLGEVGDLVEVLEKKLERITLKNRRKEQNKAAVPQEPLDLAKMDAQTIDEMHRNGLIMRAEPLPDFDEDPEPETTALTQFEVPEIEDATDALTADDDDLTRNEE